MPVPLGIVINQSIRSSIIAYIGVAIGYVNLLWLFPYYLSSDQLGLMRLIQSVSFLLATFGQLGLGQSTLKFHPEFKSQKGFLAFIMLGGVAGFLALWGLSALFRQNIIDYFSEESPLFIAYFEVTLFITFFLIHFQLLESYSRSLLKTVFPNFIRDIQLRLSMMVIVIGFGLGIIDFDWTIRLLTVVYAGLLVTIAGYLNTIKAFRPRLNFRFLTSKNLKKILEYSFYTLIGAGGTQVVLQIDSIMISGELGLESTGIYTIAFFIGVVIEMPRRSIAQITTPLISRAFRDSNREQVLKLYRQSSINQLIIGSLLLIGIWANLENIYHFIPNHETYVAGMNVVLFIGLGKLSDMAFGINGEIIVMSKYYRFNVIAIAMLAMMTIFLNYLLIPLYGIEGAAMASFLAMLLFNTAKFIFLYVRLGIQPFTRATLGFAGIAVFCLGVNALIPSQQNPFTDLMLRSTGIFLLIIGPTYFFKISEEVNGLIDGFLKRLLR